MKVPIPEITAKMTDVLRKKGIAEADIPFVVEMYLGGELQGHESHGLASFPGFAKTDFSGLEEPVVLKEAAAFFMLDAKSNSGNVLGRRLADEALGRAQKQIIGVSVVKNMDSWLRPGAIAEYVANKGFVAVVINHGGGAFIAPPGGYDPTTGTSPIAYGVPTADGPLVVDMATSMRARGVVRLANKYGTELPPDMFYDSEGNITTDPKKVWSVMPFGGHKAFSLALLIEILCGSLVGMDMMVSSKSAESFGNKTPERGALIFVIDPQQTTDLGEFKRANSELISKIKATRPLQGKEIRIPGDHARIALNTKKAEGFMEIPDELWDEIKGL